MNKKISFIVTVAIIVGAIWYLENIKVNYGTQNTLSDEISVNFPQTGNTSYSTPVGGLNYKVAENLKEIATADKNNGDKSAIEIANPTGFINASSTFSLKNLIGKKVILVDFWTYSCINCIRTIPHLTAWYQKYKNIGLEIVGIHTPEFEFEKNMANVQAAVKKYGIKYPIVLDSNYGTWHAYGNLYWPHEYLIDISGYIVYNHIGEGNYDETEIEIQKLLNQKATALGTEMAATEKTAVSVADLSGVGSPETYFGTARNQYLANGVKNTAGEQILTEPKDVFLNQLNLSGRWNFSQEYAENLSEGAKIIYRYKASHVYFVANAASGDIIEVYQDGKLVSKEAGSDVKNGQVKIYSSRLYDLIDNSDGSGEHVLELIIESPGLQCYTFTFG